MKVHALNHLNELLRSITDAFNSTPSLQAELKGTQGWINACIGIRTDDAGTPFYLLIHDGWMSIVCDQEPREPDTWLVFITEQDVADYLAAGNDEVCRMILSGRVRIEGNQAVYGYFNYLTSLITAEEDIAGFQLQILEHRRQNRLQADQAGLPDRQIRKRRVTRRLNARAVDPGVRWLDDPYLSHLSLDHFPRLMRFKQERLSSLPEITAEQGRLLTDFHLEHGFEKKKDGSEWEPHLRSAEAFRYLMSNRQALIRENDLLAGTMTPNPVCGSVTQPYTIGWSIWGELKTIYDRELDPCLITPETAETLHRHVFPFWMKRHVHQVWLDRFDNPLPARIADRLFCLNLWGLVSLNPGCPGFEKVVRSGLSGITAEIDQELDTDVDADEEKRNTLTAMKISLEAVSIYAAQLASRAAAEAARQSDPQRKAELEEMSRMLTCVPDRPARTLAEAIQTIWIMFIAVGLESMDDDIAIGRLDQILQPYFHADMERLNSGKERRNYVAHAIELVGCLFMRITSHQIAAPTIASWQNSGAPPTSTIIVGGVTAEGKDAVNDMSYIVLKVAEMLSLNDPNMHARYMPGVNSRAYLERLCEVNYITCGTPGIHNDEAVIKALSQHPGWAIEDVRDWTPTGCVEPVLPGKHLACTGDIDSNLMAPFTMALNDGFHPVPNWALGPKTGSVECFDSFDDFYAAFQTQFEFIYEQALSGSRQLLEVHQHLLPSPLYSSLLEGCIHSGRGMTHGGARYNSSGASLIAFSDVIDSLMVIKKLVFDQRKVSFRELKSAIDVNFQDHCRLHALTTAVPKFGSGDPETLAIANRVTTMVAELLHHRDNGRGGPYLTGYRSNNNHTVYGRVSGASPSGRLAGTPFTPGLTPNPSASKNLLDNLLDVAQLNPLHLDNNIAFNVRLAFSEAHTDEENVCAVADLVDTYFNQGGMQIQFIMVDVDTLIDAMAHPELYPDVIVRVSGYTGYFVQMQRDLQLEIIGRSEFAV